MGHGLLIMTDNYTVYRSDCVAVNRVKVGQIWGSLLLCVCYKVQKDKIG